MSFLVRILCFLLVVLFVSGCVLKQKQDEPDSVVIEDSISVPAGQPQVEGIAVDTVSKTSPQEPAPNPSDKTDQNNDKKLSKHNKYQPSLDTMAVN